MILLRNRGRARGSVNPCQSPIIQSLIRCGQATRAFRKNFREADLKNFWVLCRSLPYCDRKLAKFRAALEGDGDPSTVGQWITEVALERKAAERALRAHKQTRGMTRSEIREIVLDLRGMFELLQRADLADRKAVYDALNLDIVYRADGKIQVGAGPVPCTDKCVGGGT